MTAVNTARLHGPFTRQFRTNAAVALVLLAACQSLSSVAQGAEQSTNPIQTTWPTPPFSFVGSVLQSSNGRDLIKAKGKPRLDALKFTPVGDSGMADSLAKAVAKTEQERKGLASDFHKVLQAYAGEAARTGFANNIGTAMEAFVASSLAAHGLGGASAEEADQAVLGLVSPAVVSDPALLRLTNAEKQRAYDWLVCMSGLLTVGAASAERNDDEGARARMRALSIQASKEALGVSVSEWAFVKHASAAQASSTTSPQGNTAVRGLVGKWSRSQSAARPLGAPLAGFSGYFKSQYQLKADGTYAYKAEFWPGYERSNEFLVTEETGSYLVTGDSLTVSPVTSKWTLRNREGAVLKTQSRPPEKVTYRWQFHYFSGTKDTVLVLTPPKDTERDGRAGGSSLFPNSYLFDQSDNIEWRF